MNDQIAAKFDTLTSDQIQQFVENYAERIVDDMDTKTLIQFAYDTIVNNLDIQSPEDILNEVSCVYDDDIVEELMESVTV
jgi:predicted RNA-binding protein Jag